jgi:hypothetical protein
LGFIFFVTAKLKSETATSWCKWRVSLIIVVFFFFVLFLLLLLLRFFFFFVVCVYTCFKFNVFINLWRSRSRSRRRSSSSRPKCV